MKLNKDFCVTAYKVLSRCATPSDFKYLEDFNPNEVETVSAYAQALKEMVVVHTKLITTNEYDNNQLLQFNSVANRLLGEFRDGKINRINLPTITKINNTKTMGLFNKLASLFSTPVQAPASEFEIAQARTAEYQAKLDAEKVEKLRVAKETEKLRKERSRFESAVKQAKATAEAYAITKKEVVAMKLNLEKVSENYTQVVCEGLDFLNDLDNYVADLLDNSTVTKIMKEEKETAKPAFDVLDTTPVVVKPIIKTPEVETTSLWEEAPDLEVAPLEDSWGEDDEPESVVEPEVTAEPEVVKPTVKGGAKKLKAKKKGSRREAMCTEEDEASVAESHVEGSALADADDVESIF